MSLTDKQQKFIYEYLKCFNATEAARRAGYNANNGTLAQIGYENLRKPDIKDRIEQYLEENAMSAKEVLMRLANQARGDVGEFAYINSSSDLANHPQSSIVKKYKKKVWYDKEGDAHEEIELELYDSQSALQLIGKHWAIFTDKIENTGEVTLKVKYEGTDSNAQKSS